MVLALWKRHCSLTKFGGGGEEIAGNQVGRPVPQQAQEYQTLCHNRGSNDFHLVEVLHIPHKRKNWVQQQREETERRIERKMSWSQWSQGHIANNAWLVGS